MKPGELKKMLYAMLLGLGYRSVVVVGGGVGAKMVQWFRREAGRMTQARW